MSKSIPASPSISVVVAAHEVGPALDACLQAYASGLRTGDELIAVLAADATTCARVQRVHPAAAVVGVASRALTPELWTAGLLRARGDLVRVTIGPCVPAPSWREALVEAHGDGAVAVGGAIAPGPSLRCRDAAILILRYRTYVPPFLRRDVKDVPGDHANYVRSALEPTQAEWRAGFWEWEINHRLVAADDRLVLDPGMVATYVGGERARRFMAQRFHHGVRFGRSRFRPGWSLRRAVYAGAFFLPGAVFFVKIVRDTMRKPGLRGHLLRSVGWISCYLAAWSLGEWLGAVRGALPPTPSPGGDAGRPAPASAREARVPGPGGPVDAPVSADRQEP